MCALAAPRRCPVCNREPKRSFRLSNGARLLRCPRCSLGWWRWAPFEPGYFYDREYFQSGTAQRGYGDYGLLEPGLRRTARSRLRRILRLSGTGVGSPLRLFEIGCGTGCFLDEARRAGWEVGGCEVSAYAAERAGERGLAVTCAAIERLDLPPQRYDCVALWDVIEHLRDPVGALATAARALRVGGVLALSTGDITSLCARLSGPGWHLFNLPEHLYFFSPRSLRRLLMSTGCRVRAMTRELNWVPISYVLERLGKSLGGSGQTVPRAWLRNWMVPATLFDVLGVYAVRAAPLARESGCRVTAGGL